MYDSSVDATPKLLALPSEILLHIISFLPLENEVILSYVCRQLYQSLGSAMRKFAVRYHLHLRGQFFDRSWARLELLCLLERDRLIAGTRLICGRFGTLHHESFFSMAEQRKGGWERRCWHSNRWCGCPYRGSWQSWSLHAVRRAPSPRR